MYLDWKYVYNYFIISKLVYKKYYLSNINRELKSLYNIFKKYTFLLRSNKKSDVSFKKNKIILFITEVDPILSSIATQNKEIRQIKSPEEIWHNSGTKEPIPFNYSFS